MTDQLLCPSCHTPLPEAAAFCYVCGTPTPTGMRADSGAATTRPSLQSAAAVVDVRKRLEKALGPNFTVGELVGRGGFAEVFSVRDNRLKRDLAVKVLSPELVVNQLMLHRFRREAEAVAALRHASIVPIYDIGESGGIAYILMPLIKGETLKKRLERDGRITIPETRRIIREIAGALSIAHEAGLVHRDIKPENVMLEGPRQQVLVMDFGIAKALDPDQTGMTSSGLIVGTPHFMSPEQASGEPVDARSDQYSLAVLGYRMLTGAHPFDGETTRALLYKQVFETPAPAKERFPEIPQSLSDAIQRGMAKDPKERYDTIDEFAAAVLQESTTERKALAAAKPASPARPGVKPGEKKDEKKGEKKPAAAAAKPGATAAQSPRPRALAVMGAAVVVVAVIAAVALSNRAGSGATPAQPVTAAPPPPPPPAAQPEAPATSDSAAPIARAPRRERPPPEVTQPTTSTTAPRIATRPTPPPPPAAPQTCGDAVRASNWTVALTQCGADAERGNVSGMLALAGLYERGQGTAADPVAAAEWYRKASDAGSAEAAYRLGVMYEEGRGVDANVRDAANYYLQAARRGVPAAMRSIARAYATGLGVQQNDRQAADWYRRAVGAGDIPSTVKLAEMYNQGRGVPRNDAEAARLYRRGAEAGDAEAQYFLAMVFFTGRGVAASEDSAMTWLRRSAEKGYAPAVAELARRAN